MEDIISQYGHRWCKQIHMFTSPPPPPPHPPPITTTTTTRLGTIAFTSVNLTSALHVVYLYVTNSDHMPTNPFGMADQFNWPPHRFPEMICAAAMGSVATIVIRKYGSGGEEPCRASAIVGE